MVVRIILDTNFFMIPKDFKVDIISEFDKLFGLNAYELFTFQAVFNELDSLFLKLSGSEKQLAKLGRTFLQHLQKTKGLKTISSNNELYLDDALTSFLTNHSDYYVATTDKQLQNKVKELGAKVICVRQGKYLMVK